MLPFLFFWFVWSCILDRCFRCQGLQLPLKSSTVFLDLPQNWQVEGNTRWSWFGSASFWPPTRFQNILCFSSGSGIHGLPWTSWRRSCPFPNVWASWLPSNPLKRQGCAVLVHCKVHRFDNCFDHVWVHKLVQEESAVFQPEDHRRPSFYRPLPSVAFPSFFTACSQWQKPRQSCASRRSNPWQVPRRSLPATKATQVTGGGQKSLKIAPRGGLGPGEGSQLCLATRGFGKQRLGEDQVFSGQINGNFEDENPAFARWDSS